MLVRSLCKHYTDQVREEGEKWEHSGPLYEHIVAVDEETEPEQTTELDTSRQQKPANSARRR